MSLLDIIEDYCALREYRSCRIDGKTQLIDRGEQMDAFQREGSDVFVFLLSTRAGGLGINLFSADSVIIYDSDFNPMMDLQAIDRAHRIGQTREVTVYRFITENTVEEKIRERQMIKLKWEGLVIKSQHSNDNLKDKEFKAILAHGANEILNRKEGTINQNEDIDDILKRAEEKTIKMRQKCLESTSLKMEGCMNDKDIDKLEISQIDQQAIDEA